MCPICSQPDCTRHLVASYDRTFGTLQGGALFDKQADLDQPLSSLLDRLEDLGAIRTTEDFEAGPGQSSEYICLYHSDPAKLLSKAKL